ncbi:CRISPR type III-associated protein, TIGR04423 family [Spirosomataceae bacterium TFI 002]|nr:CRISPR type III-associated protein, TIGR04423 family [Spirosomataceae bacterium TFI 002]
MVTKINISYFWEHLKKDGWEGYIWRVSDMDEPKEIYLQPTSILQTEANPVYNRIQEANFYNQEDQISMHIKLIDGEELIFLYELKDLDDNNFKLSDEVSYEGSKSVLGEPNFRNLYELTPSLVSEGAFSWVQVAQIFTGFN